MIKVLIEILTSHISNNICDVKIDSKYKIIKFIIFDYFIVLEIRLNNMIIYNVELNLTLYNSKEKEEIKFDTFYSVIFIYRKSYNTCYNNDYLHFFNLLQNMTHNDIIINSQINNNEVNLMESFVTNYKINLRNHKLKELLK